MSSSVAAAASQELPATPPQRQLSKPPPRGSAAVAAATPQGEDDRAARLTRRAVKSSLLGLVVSFLVNGLLLGIFACVVLTQTRPLEPPLVTVLEDTADASVPLQELAEIEVIAGSDAADDASNLLVELPSTLPTVDASVVNVGGNIAVGDPSASGEGEGDFVGNEFLLRAPENAVRQGRFAAWTHPVAMRGEQTKPGQAPRPRQSYHIVIEMKLPPHMRSYPVRDLVGSITGSDTYTQTLPKDTFTYNRQGKLIAVDSRDRLPVRNGVVQLVVLVPGASKAGIRDTIKLESRQLKESETLLIVFGSGRRERG